MPTARITRRKKQGVDYITIDDYEMKSIKQGDASFYELVGRSLTGRALSTGKTPITVTRYEAQFLTEYRISTPEVTDILIITFEIIR